MILNEETFQKYGYTIEKAKYHNMILCKCDYCGRIFERDKDHLLRKRCNPKQSCGDKICKSLKFSETSTINFGVDNPSKSTIIKEKIKKHFVETLGVDNPFKSEEIKNKIKEKNFKNHGVLYTGQIPLAREKAKKTWLKNLGVDHPSKSPIVLEKIKATFAKKYQGGHPFKDEKIIEIRRKTWMEKYGSPYPKAVNKTKTQNSIKKWLESIGFKFESDYSILNGKEIDLYNEDKKIGLEFGALHWHHEKSKEPRDRNYHYFKYEKCKEKGVYLITIFSDEWKYKNEQCKDFIRSILGVFDKRIYARKCLIKEICKKEACDFIEKNHIQGKNNLGKIYYGIFHEEELLGCMSLGRHCRNSNVLTLDRLCFKIGVQIIGGSSKLFKKCIEWAKKNNYTKIISFSDNRWSFGNIYQILGFSLDKELKQDYCYVNIKKPYERISKQSQKKKNTNCPSDKTESEWAEEKGLAKIWDCGKKRWIYHL